MENSGYIGVDKRFAKAGLYGLRKHRQERSLGNFYAKVHAIEFNIDIRDTEANIRARTGDAVGVIAFGTDTHDLYVYDGATWQSYLSFKNAYSVDFDGADDYCAIGSSGYLGSLSAWFKPDSVISASSTTRNLCGFTGVAPYAGSGGISFANTAGVVTNEIICIYTGDWVYAYSHATETISTDWHHVAIRWTGTDYEIWLDGVEKKNDEGQNASGAKVKLPISAFNIGRRNSNRYFAGLIDEVALWSTPLSAADVVAIYNSGTPADLSLYSPDGWWRMGDNDGGAGTTITDQGSGSNDGTLTNGPTYSTNTPPT